MVTSVETMVKKIINRWRRLFQYVKEIGRSMKVKQVEREENLLCSILILNYFFDAIFVM